MPPLVTDGPGEALGRFGKARVLVIGDVMLDRYLYGQVERISPEAPIPVLAIQRTRTMPGGAANVARNIAALDGRVTLLGVVGADRQAQELTELLSAFESLRTRFIADVSRPTTVKTRYVAEGQQMLRCDEESTASLPESIEDKVLQSACEAVPQHDVVLLSDYAKGVLGERLVQRVIGVAREHDRPVLVDPKGRSFERYRGASVLTPNRRELQLATARTCETDDQVVVAAHELLLQTKTDALLVTRSEAGMSLIPRQGPPLHIRSRAREVFDVSGAGDTAIACFALGIAAGASPEWGARLANMAAGIVVEKRGTAVVSRAELRERVDQSEDGASHKQFTLDRVLQLVGDWRDRGFRIAFANGCFDLLHPGHVALLNQARASSDRLIVGLNSDQSVRRLKGEGRPAQSQVARATVLGSLKAVDAVVIFEEDTPLSLIQAIQPDVLVKGSDYSADTVVGSDIVLARGGRVLLADLVAGQSTSLTLGRVHSMARV